MPNGGPSFNTITPIKIARFLVMTGNGNRQVATASAATAPIVGISAQFAGDPQLPEMQEQYELGRTAGGGSGSAYEALAANGSANNPVPVNAHSEQDTVCGLIAGGTINEGDLLTADSDGRGIATTTANNYVGARALESGVVGELIEVEIFKTRI